MLLQKRHCNHYINIKAT